MAIPYLPALFAPFNSAGRSRASIARGCAISNQTFREWMTGQRVIPAHKRERFQEAMGRPIDWGAYDAQVKAHLAARAFVAPELPEPPAPKPPQRPAEAPKRPAAPPPPAPAPKAPARPPAPAPKPPKSPYKLFGFIPIIDDTEEARP